MEAILVRRGGALIWRLDIDERSESYFSNSNDHFLLIQIRLQLLKITRLVNITYVAGFFEAIVLQRRVVTQIHNVLAKDTIRV